MQNFSKFVKFFCAMTSSWVTPEFSECWCVQCHLDSQGATDLVIDLVMSNHSGHIFQEAIELAIALLDGGNSVIQVCHAYGVIHVYVQCTILL